MKKAIRVIPSKGVFDETKEFIRIVFLSDTHEKLGEIIEKCDIPDGEILIHCGDFSDNGGIDSIIKFNDDLGKLPHKKKIVICGNHDYYHRISKEEIQKYLTNATYLQEEFCVVSGIKIYGDPRMTNGPRMAFRSTEDPDIVWKCIPMDADIVVTHIPPLKRCDFDTGCPALLARIQEVKPKVHCFGHIHGANGFVADGDILFVNAAIGSEDFNPVLFLDYYV